MDLVMVWDFLFNIFKHYLENIVFVKRLNIKVCAKILLIENLT